MASQEERELYINHPLTEEIMYKIHRPHAGYCDPFGEDDMRAAADWQLEQVIEWLKANLMEYSPEKGYTYLDLFWDDAEIRVDLVVERLKEAMRPRQQEETND